LNIENLFFITPRSSSIIPHSKPRIPNVPFPDGLGVDGDGAHAAHEHIFIPDIARRAARAPDALALDKQEF
jgi:hypothetical protein